MPQRQRPKKQQGGAVTCPRCNVKTTYAECGRCHHKFSEPWLTSMEERAKRIHVGSGSFRIPLPNTQEIVNRKATS